MRQRRRSGAAGVERADGQGRPADVRQGPPHRRLGVGRAAGGGAVVDRIAQHRRPRDGVLASRARAASRSRSSARAARRSASGTRRSTCARCASSPRCSACRTTRRRCRRRCPRTPRRACSPTRPPATASPASPSTAPIRTPSRRHSRGPPIARVRGRVRRSSRSVAMRMCGHAHHDDMLYHGKESQPSWDYPPLHDGGYANREHLRVLEQARSDCPLRRQRSRAKRSSSAASSTRSSAGPQELVERQAAGGHRGAVARAARGRASACSRTKPPRTRVEVSRRRR